MTPRIATAVAAILGLSLVLLFAGSTATQAGGLPFAVNGTTDESDANIGNDICATAGGVCTLRAAIEEVNATAPNHWIYFQLPDCPGAGCVISPTSALPILMKNGIQIDGGSQPGYSGEPLVTIDGSLAGAGVSGIRLEGSNTVVRGLEIRDFTLDGVDIGGTSQTGPWTVRENLIHNNGQTGVNNYYCSGEASITGNSILQNNLGVYDCGDNIFLNFNRIYGNASGVYDEGGNPATYTRGENNWWGCNEGPINNPSDCDTYSGYVDHDPWLTLTIKAVPNSIAGGETSSLSGYLLINSDAVDTTGSDWVLDGTPVLFQTNLGSVGSPSVLKETNSGGANATLTADEGPGTATVSVTVDQEQVATTVEITSAPPTPTPTLPPTDSPTPTGTPGPTDTPTASPTPTPTFTPGPELTQGDIDCDGDVDGADGTKLLAGFLELSYSRAPSCPGVGEDVASLFGDVNCDDGVNPLDALAIFARVAGLIQDNGVCTDIGDTLS